MQRGRFAAAAVTALALLCTAAWPGAAAYAQSSTAGTSAGSQTAIGQILWAGLTPPASASTPSSPPAGGGTTGTTAPSTTTPSSGGSTTGGTAPAPQNNALLNQVLYAGQTPGALPPPAPSTGTSPSGTGGSTAPAGPASGGTGGSGGSTAPAQGQVGQVLDLINAARQNVGAAPLTLNATLSTLAQERAQALVATNTWTHDVPGYGYPWTMVQAAGVQFVRVGEDLADGYSPTQAFDMLMADAMHRANLLYSAWNEIGIGLAPQPSNGSVVLDLLFAET